MSRTSNLLDVLFHPDKAFQEIGENENHFFPRAVLILIGTSIFYPSIDLFSVGFDWLVESEIDEILTEFVLGSVLVSFVTGMLFASFTFFIGKKLGGKGSFKGVFSSICYSSFPFVIIGLIFVIPIALLVFFLEDDFITMGLFWFAGYGEFFILIWAFVLLLMAIKISHKLTWGKTIGSTIIGALITTIPYLAMLSILQPDYFQRLFWYF